MISLVKNYVQNSKNEGKQREKKHEEQGTLRIDDYIASPKPKGENIQYSMFLSFSASRDGGQHLAHCVGG